jgi:hypothetical protein
MKAINVALAGLLLASGPVIGGLAAKYVTFYQNYVYTGSAPQASGGSREWYIADSTDNKCYPAAVLKGPKTKTPWDDYGWYIGEGFEARIADYGGSEVDVAVYGPLARSIFGGPVTNRRFRGAPACEARR